MRFQRPLASLLRFTVRPSTTECRPAKQNLWIRIRYSSSRSAAANMETVDTSARLAQLRQLMAKHKVDVYSM